MTDKELIREALGGNQQAYTTLYEQEHRKIKLVLLGMSGGKDVDDLVQDTFVNAFRYLHTFKGDAKFSTWLHRIARNQFLMECRKKKQQFVEIDEEFVRTYGRADKHSDIFLHEYVQEEINKLSKARKRTFVLHTVLEYSFVEVAKMTHCTVGAVKSYDSRARNIVRKALTASLVPLKHVLHVGN